MNKRYNIIFLDIDGVLNGYNFWNVLGWDIVCRINNKKIRWWYKYITDPCGVHERKVKRLSKIVKSCNAKVVMSSSWRTIWYKRRYEHKSGDFKKLNDLFIKYDIDVIDITPRLDNRGRDCEIIQWLSQNEDKVKNFIILDDENSFMRAFHDDIRFIQTSSVPKGVLIQGHSSENTGLSRKHMKQAIKVLSTIGDMGR